MILLWIASLFVYLCVWLCISALENEEGGGSLCLLLQLNLSSLTR